MGLEWQEEAIRFFDSVRLTSLTSEDSYVELANLVESNLAHLSPYFNRLAEAMRLWVKFWRDRTADTLRAYPSRSSNTNLITVVRKTEIFYSNGTCQTYNQRYAKCKAIQSKSKEWQQDLFLRHGRSGKASEAAILRMGNWIDASDNWLALCSFILEASSRKVSRHVYLHVPIRFNNTMPIEFQGLINYHDEEKLASTSFSWNNTLKFAGFFNGDILVSTLIIKLDYKHVWVFESDCRYIGNWGLLFDKVPGEDDLVVFTGSFDLKKIIDKEVWWFNSGHYHGLWKERKPKEVGSLTMAFRISLYLAQLVYSNAVNGTYNDNQEVNLMTNAHQAGLTIRHINKTEQSQEFEAQMQGNANAIYNKFMCSEYICHDDFLLHKVYSTTCIN